MDTISDITESRLCSGCSVCVSACPTEAITAVKDAASNLYTFIVASDKCIRCGECVRVCPGLSGMKTTHSSHEIATMALGGVSTCYIGYTSDTNIRRQCSSGGLVTQTLIHAFENDMIDGAMVVHALSNAPLEPESFVARSVDDIRSAVGSRYCPVTIYDALNEIVSTRGRYAIVGLPCQLEGIRRLLQRRNVPEDRVVLYLGLFCSGVPGFKATHHALGKLRVSPDSVAKISYRGEGWPGRMKVETVRGEVFSMAYPEYFDGIEGLYVSLRCRICLDWFAAHADISFGDAWLDVARSDENGTSIVLCRSESGQRVIENMANRGIVKIDAIPLEDLIASQPGFLQKISWSGAAHRLYNLAGTKLSHESTDSTVRIRALAFYGFSCVVSRIRHRSIQNLVVNSVHGVVLACRRILDGTSGNRRD